MMNDDVRVMTTGEKIIRALLADRLQHTSNLDAEALAKFQGLQAELDAHDSLAEDAEAEGIADEQTGDAGDTKEAELGKE